jgi:hypothetical protein
LHAGFTFDHAAEVCGVPGRTVILIVRLDETPPAAAALV